jgi:putative transposase
MPEKGEELSKFMQWLMTSHVRRYHRHHGTSGHVWQGRFKSFIIQKDEHLLAVLRYIESNPIRAGLTESAESAKAWNWSSHTETSGERPRDLVDECLTELPADWQKYVDTPLTGKELERIRKSVNRQSPYGVFECQVKICKDLGLESTMRPRGRQCNGS